MAAKTVYKYSEAGDLMELHEYNEKGKKCGKTLFTYTSHRKYATQTVFLSDGSVEVATYHYDARFPKLDVLDSVVWKTPAETRVEVYFYSKYKSVRGCSTPSDKPLASKPGPLLEKHLYVNGNLKERHNYEYAGDSTGRFLKSESFDDGTGRGYYWLEYEYDAQKRIHSVTKRDDGTELAVEYKTVWEYDDYGNVTAEKWYNGNNEMTNATYYVYVYDERHNWVKQVAFDEKRHANTIVEREITYY